MSELTIVRRLRLAAQGEGFGHMLEEAASTIEQLERENAQLQRDIGCQARAFGEWCNTVVRGGECNASAG